MADIAWQHWVFTRKDDDSDQDIMDVLANLGSAYYELIAVRPRADGRVTYYMKRPSEASN